jgi:phage tail-like protein
VSNPHYSFSILGDTMARPASVDPVQKFRFDVKIVSVSLNPANLINAARNGLELFGRVGFSTVDIPEQTTNVIKYRENTDNPAPRKIAGLASFNDITLTRGVISNAVKGNKTKDFYKWIARTNYFNPGLAIINELTGTNRNVILPQSENYRRDVIIIARDREGRAARRWYILNAFPISYKGGDGLDGSSEANLVESLTLTYELAFELPSGADAAQEFLTSVLSSAVGGTTGDIANIAGELELGD